MKQGLPEQGFSLLEMLIAVALMAVLASLSWRALDTTTRSSERLNTAVDQTLNLLRTLGQLETDISRHADADILGPPPQGTGGVFPSGIRWSTDGLVVRRSSHDGAWQEVAWTVTDKKLWRAAGPPVHTLPLPAAHTAELMLEEVKNFSLRAWLPELGWVDPDTTSGVAATGVEIVIQHHRHGSDETYRKVVMLP